MSQHVISATTDPNVAPTAIGQQWINTQTRRWWTSVGTGSVGDWLLPPGARLDEVVLHFAGGDEATVITSGTGKVKVRAEYSMRVTAVRAYLGTGSSSGVVTFDLNRESGASFLDTKLTIDQGEKSSQTAATPAVITADTVLASDEQITVDFDGVGTGSIGPKFMIFGIKQ